jgi:hypothetical protein
MVETEQLVETVGTKYPSGIVVVVAATVGQSIKIVEATTRLNGLAGRLILRLYI